MGYTLVCEEEEDLTLPEDSIHQGKVIEIAFRTINWNDKRTGDAKSADKFDIWFEVTGSSDDKYLGRRVKGTVDASLTNRANNKYRNWAGILLGREITPGMGLDTDDLVGLSAEIVIGHRPSKDGGRVFEEVTDIMSLDASSYSEPPF